MKNFPFYPQNRNFRHFITIFAQSKPPFCSSAENRKRLILHTERHAPHSIVLREGRSPKSKNSPVLALYNKKDSQAESLTNNQFLRPRRKSTSSPKKSAILHRLVTVISRWQRR